MRVCGRAGARARPARVPTRIQDFFLRQVLARSSPHAHIAVCRSPGRTRPPSARASAHASDGRTVPVLPPPPGSGPRPRIICRLVFNSRSLLNLGFFLTSLSYIPRSPGHMPHAACRTSAGSKKGPGSRGLLVVTVPCSHRFASFAAAPARAQRASRRATPCCASGAPGAPAARGSRCPPQP